MDQSNTQFILTVNGGSSSIKFALFDSKDPSQRILAGHIEGIGQPRGKFAVKGANEQDNFSRDIVAHDQTDAVTMLMDWLQGRVQHGNLAAVGHRVVHGGPKYWEPQRITREMIAELHQLSPFDPEHLPEEILLTEAFHKRFPDLVQIACFDTAFHYNMPRVARWVPIPRRYDNRGVRRYGFHGLSCEYLMQELGRLAPAEAQGRVIIAHLGNGASVTAVRGGKSIDTSMSLTPTAGLVMSTRTGDLDPSVAWYLSRAENITAQQFHEMVNQESGLLGVSEISSDMRELLSREDKDARAAEAVALFCYQAKKWICAFTGVLEGLDAFVFSGGIGENSWQVRERICAGMGFLGIELDPRANAAHADVISSGNSKVRVRVIRTNEESIIAQTVRRILR